MFASGFVDVDVYMDGAVDVNADRHRRGSGACVRTGPDLLAFDNLVHDGCRSDHNLIPFGVVSQTLVVMSGLPGSGKSTIARALAAAAGLCLFELDRLEGVLARHAVDLESLGWGGYELLTTLADDNLALGRGVILDSVTWTRALRWNWSALAARHHARFRPIEVSCSDAAEHRRRIEARTRGIAGLPEVPWARVEASRSLYESWDGDRLSLDSLRPLDDLVRTALAYVMSEP